MEEVKGPAFRKGCRFMAPDGSVATVVHVVTDGPMPVYNVTIVGYPDMDHGHVFEHEVCEPGWKVAAPGTDNFVPIV